ncbi:hypothetical protein [Aquimarina sp. 2201CG5-10]|uniref:hypothetical protein n=1 Tax=Aquimarina callyspongiae TaxID=3098150 RepID=UPI002AB3BF00|nr:hypothetical protein [Aquimarina sp. 2201CG5-10]MDY8137560.1 hypothetical protein [Aquimarina sp. 2201CG5-10]
MGIQPVNKLRYYRSCNEIPVWNFNEMVKCQDYNWLIYDYDGYSKYDGQIDVPECEKIWENLRNEFFKLSNNQASMQIIWLEAEIDYLKRRFEIVFALLGPLISNSVSAKNKPKFIDHLRRWRYYIDSSQPLKTELEKLTKQHQSSKIAITRKENELKSLIDDAASKDINVFRQKIKLQRVLTMQIDLRKTPVTEWVEMFNEAAEIIKESKRGERDKSNK